jgi:hypothetical protein
MTGALAGGGGGIRVNRLHQLERLLSTFVMISQNRADAKRQVIADQQWTTVQEEDRQNSELLDLSKLVWRHFPDPAAHPHAAMFALAAEAAAAATVLGTHARDAAHASWRPRRPTRRHAPRQSRSRARHRDDAGGPGTERILEDVTSVLASGVESVPTLFVNEERYGGEHPAAVITALDRAARMPSTTG